MSTRASLIAVLAATTALASPAAANAAYARASDDRAVPFFKSTSALAPGDVNGTIEDLYVRTGGTTKLVSSGTAAASGAPYVKGATAEGAALFSTQDALLPADQDDDADLYLRNASGLKVIAPGAEGEPAVYHAGHSADLGFVYLETFAKLTPGDTDTFDDVYRYDTASGALTHMSPNSPGNAHFMGATTAGNVFFESEDQVTKSDTDDEADVFFTPDGKAVGQATHGNGDIGADFEALGRSNGHVVYRTREPLVAADVDAEDDLYLQDYSGKPILLTPSPNGAAAAQSVFFSEASPSVGRVIFTTTEPLVAGDLDQTKDFYARDGGTTTLLTPGTTPAQKVGVSDDAKTLLVSTKEALLPTDTDKAADLYRVSPAGLSHVTKTNGEHDHTFGRMSPNGNVVAFTTAEPISSDDTDALADVYVATGGLTFLASGRDGTSSGPDVAAQSADVLAGGAAVFVTKERLRGTDRDDEEDLYGYQIGAGVAHVSIDEHAPETTLDAPGAVAEGAAVTASMTATEQATFECRVDDGAWAPCPAAWKPGVLANGKHVLAARAVDRDGNADAMPAERTLQVGDEPAPVVAPTQTPGPVNPEITETPGPQQSVTTTASTPGAAITVADHTAPRINRASMRRRGGRLVVTWTQSEAGAVRIASGRRAISRTGRVGVNRVTLPRTFRASRRRTLRVQLKATDAAGNASTAIKLALRG